MHLPLRTFTCSLPLRFFLSLFFILLMAQAEAQNSRIDSLKTLLTQQPRDTSRVKTLLTLTRELRRTGDTLTLTYGLEGYHLAGELKFLRARASIALQLGIYMDANDKPDEALLYAREALAIFQQLGIKDAVAACYNNIGTYNYTLTRYDSAIAYFRKSLSLYEELGITKEVAKLMGNVALCQEAMGDYAGALEVYFKALKMCETIGNKEGMAVAYNQIAINYSRQKDFRKALEFYQKSLDTFFEEHNLYFAGLTYNDMVRSYIEIGEYEKAMSAAQKALTIAKQQRSLSIEADALKNIGFVYFKTNKLPLAASYYKKALATRPERVAEGKTTDLLLLSQLYTTLGKADSAIYFATQAIGFAKRITETLSLHKTLYEGYKLKGDFANATLYLEKYMADKDSIFSGESNQKFRDLQLKYETEKKEQQIAALNTEKTLQENKVLLLGALVTVTLLVITFLFLTIRSNKKRQHSERLLLNEQLRNKNLEAEKLQELDEMKSRFFANIAHEFRTPLTLISGPVENLLEDNKDKYVREQLMLVKNNSGRLLGLINQLLDLSKLESGVTKLELHKSDVMAFVKGVTFSFQSLADEREISLECHTTPAALIMDFDRDKLEKVMANLLSNAFKFTPDLGSVKVFAKFTNADGQNNLEIRVKDSGAGIPEDQIGFIFNRFYQADNAPVRNAQGSGIGLALTKELVELHGGTISVSSPEGGAVFSVSLPVRDDATVTSMPATENLTTAIQAETLHVNGNGAGEQIVHSENDAAEIVLVIEDNAEVRHFIIESLRGHYKIISAVDGDEGIAMAFDHIPDLIVSDVMMPGKSGFDVSRTLKADERTSHIPVILLTAKAGFENKMEGLETGADDFIPKPFSTRELLTRIRNLIITRKKLREKYLSYALSGNNTSETIEDAFLIKLREAIETRLDDTEFSVEDLCREVGMSRTHLHRKLKALTNQSASQFIRILKLQHGQQLLRQGKFNVSEVADKVGFASLTYFSSSYTSHFGYAPSEEKSR